MIAVEVTLEAQVASEEDVRQITQDGVIVEARGTLNRKWDDCAATSPAESLGLDAVVWSVTWDDSPSMLTLVLFFCHYTAPDLEIRICETRGVEDWTFIG